MTVDPEIFRDVIEKTRVIRPPRQALATFGTTSIDYYLVTEPIYSDLVGTPGKLWCVTARSPPRDRR